MGVPVQTHLRRCTCRHHELGQSDGKLAVGKACGPTFGTGNSASDDDEISSPEIASQSCNRLALQYLWRLYHMTLHRPLWCSTGLLSANADRTWNAAISSRRASFHEGPFEQHCWWHCLSFVKANVICQDLLQEPNEIGNTQSQNVGNSLNAYTQGRIECLAIKCLR